MEEFQELEKSGLTLNVPKLYHDATHGNFDAAYNLGLCYRDGVFGLRRSVLLSRRFLKIACMGEFPPAFGAIGELYLVKPFKNIKKAICNFHKGAKLFEPYSIFSLGNCNYKGIGVPKNFVNALDLYLSAKALGYPDAEFNIEVAVDAISKTSDDIKQLTRMSTEFNNKIATFRLGNIYAFVQNPPNVEKAIECFSMLSDDASSMYNLGIIYECLIETSDSKALALKHYKIASGLGHEKATEIVNNWKNKTDAK